MGKELQMTAWTSDELNRIAAADELQIAPRRADGTLRDPVIIWVVAHDDRLYVRSVNGPAAAWFRGTQVLHEGHVRAGGVEKDVMFVDAPHDLDDAIDAAFRAKYHRYAASIVNPILAPLARSATLELVPR
jgi:hypothetical protein